LRAFFPIDVSDIEGEDELRFGARFSQSHSGKIMKLRDMLGLLVCGTLLASTAFGGRGQAADGVTVYAKGFSAAPHAGTMSDPWPSSAITRAINSLPQTGGTVIVEDGIWLFKSDERVLRGNFVLQGSSLNAQLIFTTGTLQIGWPGIDIFDVVISTATVDQSGADINAPEGVQLWQCNSCELSDSVLYGNANSSRAVFIAFGGSDGRILRNKFTSRSAGGSQLQINPLGDSSNSGFLVANNELDSVSVLIIGANNIHVTGNYMHNQTLGNFVAMMFASTTTPTSNLLFDYNVIDGAFVYGQGAAISGIPEDPNLSGVIENITIDHNTLRGGSAIIAANYFDSEVLATCPDISQTYNIQITNNSLESQWGGDSTIDVRGGGSGSVNGAWIDGNVFSNEFHQRNTILRDNHSYNVSIGSNLK
jgi:hypothetical protein